MAIEAATITQLTPPLEAVDVQPKTKSWDPIVNLLFWWIAPLKNIPLVGPQIPNLLSASRTLGIPVGSDLYDAIQLHQHHAAWVCVFKLALLALTDALDGFAARKMGIVSDFGAAIDALFDKVFAVGLLFFWWKLVASSQASSLPVVRVVLLFVVGQELCLVAAACYGFVKKYKVKSNIFGKIKFNVQVVAIGAGFAAMIENRPDLSVTLTGVLLLVAFWFGFLSLTAHWKDRTPVGLALVAP